MASRSCIRFMHKTSAQCLHQAKVQPKLLGCFPAISSHPGVLGMLGVRYATKAKVGGGGPKPKPVPGYRVGVTKGFVSQHSGSLKGSYGASDRLLDDIMIRKYIDGVFYDHIASDIIIKRKDNRIVIAFIIKRNCDINQFYFLTAFSEKLLEQTFGCVVSFEPQSAGP